MKFLRTDTQSAVNIDKIEQFRLGGRESEKPRVREVRLEAVLDGGECALIISRHETFPQAQTAMDELISSLEDLES